MRTIKNKASIVTTLILVLTIAATLITIMPVVALKGSTAYLSVRPDPIGLRQTLLVNAWTSPQPPLIPGTATGRPRYYNFTFTKPNAASLNIGPLKSFGEGTVWFEIVVDQIGVWTLTFVWGGDEIFEGCTATTQFTVQQEAIPSWPPAQLPTEYWERPISADNREWYTIAGNWLMASYNNSNSWQGSGGFNPYSAAPSSSHILWERSSGMGGLIGGDYVAKSFGSGSFSPPVIMDGNLYYNTPDGFVCVDLRTGEQKYKASGSFNVGVPVVGGTPELRSVAGTTYTRYNAYTGQQISQLTGATSGYLGWGAWDGTRLWVVVKEKYILCWSASKVVGTNWASGIVWNSTVPERTGGHLRMWKDIIVCAGVAEGSIVGGAANITSISIAFNATSGVELWRKVRPYVLATQCCVGYGKLYQQCIETGQIIAFDLYTGNEVWRFDVSYPWGEFGTYTPTTAYGNLYWGTYDGNVYCINTNTGQLVWEFYAGDSGMETPYGTWPFWLGPTVADGKVYAGTSEHSPSQPRMRGNRLFCIDAKTGDGIWNISGAIGSLAVADGYLVGCNEYDANIYCFGKGKTATTVVASPNVAVNGSTVLIEGTILDQSPAQPGTPCVSRQSMSAWMEYLHMQKPAPPHADITGVPVTLYASAEHGAHAINLGTVTSDEDGYFNLTWTPTTADHYRINAIFNGDNSYYSSYGTDFLDVTAAPPAQPEPEPAPAYTPMDLGIITAVAVAIIIGIVNLYSIRKLRK